MKVKAIFGPPGTGKTRTLVEIAHEQAEKTGKHVLYLSYTKAAAAEAVSRVDDNRIKPSTLHSFAFNALGMNRAAVVDRIKLAEFGKATGIPFQGSERGSDEPQEGDEYQTVLEYANNRIIDPMDAYEVFGKPGTMTRFEWFIKAYTEWKKTYGYMDFDDMLQHFTKAPFVKLQAESVILDEGQDCTPQQWLAFLRIIENAKNVWVAGDDDQAIYEWSGANPHGMIEFAEESDGEVTVLDQSWRVPRAAYRDSQALIGQVSKRVEKVFKPRDAEGSVTRYGDFWDVDLQKFYKSGGGMVLCRDQFRLKEIEREFQRMMLPYDVLGRSSPWTNKTAQALRNGNDVEIPTWWRRFYDQWDPKAKININLSTIHQAKGREAKRVIVDLQMTAKVLLDLSRNPDPEVRVWYVALTRTGNELIICGNNPLI